MPLSEETERKPVLFENRNDFENSASIVKRQFEVLR
jgi:hypothetical protein